jgi:hypothetical protein
VPGDAGVSTSAYYDWRGYGAVIVDSQTWPVLPDESPVCRLGGFQSADVGWNVALSCYQKQRAFQLTFYVSYLELAEFLTEHGSNLN